MGLIEDLIKEGWLKTPRLIEAFYRIKRKDFLPEDKKDWAEFNEALPIGFGQTISQPLVVAFMLELLQPQTGEKILDIGSGSGWTASLLAHFVSQQAGVQSAKCKTQNCSGKFKIEKPQGRVIALEIVPQLAVFARENIAKYNFIKRGVVEVICADGSEGWQEQAPYDKILVSASAKEITRPWQEQLKAGGRIVAVVGESIVLWLKKDKNQFEKKAFPGFVFVPLVNNEGGPR